MGSLDPSGAWRCEMYQTTSARLMNPGISRPENSDTARARGAPGGRVCPGRGCTASCRSFQVRSSHWPIKPVQFSMLSCTGWSPARVTRAELMLRSYNLTVKEVAANCGDTYTAYFCRTFKKICKVTPRSSAAIRLHFCRLPSTG